MGELQEAEEEYWGLVMRQATAIWGHADSLSITALPQI